MSDYLHKIWANLDILLIGIIIGAFFIGGSVCDLQKAPLQSELNQTKIQLEDCSAQKTSCNQELASKRQDIASCIDRAGKLEDELNACNQNLTLVKNETAPPTRNLSAQIFWIFPSLTTGWAIIVGLILSFALFKIEVKVKTHNQVVHHLVFILLVLSIISTILAILQALAALWTILF